MYIHHMPKHTLSPETVPKLRVIILLLIPVQNFSRDSTTVAWAYTLTVPLKPSGMVHLKTGDSLFGSRICCMILS